MDNLTLRRWRAVDAARAVLVLCDYAKPDPTYQPVVDPTSSRWHVRAGDREFELILTGPKFWDTRSMDGGGGAIDLAMHLYECGFRQASRRVKEAGL